MHNKISLAVITACPLSRNTIDPFAKPSFQSILIHGWSLRKFWWAAQTRKHDFIIRRQVVHDLELFHSEVTGHYHPAKGDQKAY